MKLRLFPLLSLLVAVALLIQGAPLPAAAQAELDPAGPVAPTAFFCDTVTEIPMVECEENSRCSASRICSIRSFV